MLVRSAERTDIEKIVLLEQREYSPWSQQLVETELACYSGIQLVAEKDDSISGWCCARINVPEAELLKITVDRDTRRRGVASTLLTHLFRLLQAQSCRTLLLEVRQQNTGALGLYEKLQFETVGMRKNYYRNPSDNAMILEKKLI